MHFIAYMHFKVVLGLSSLSKVRELTENERRQKRKDM